MLIIENKRHGITFRTIWYAEKPYRQSGINRYRYAKFNMQGSSKAVDTLITDLSEGEEEIIAHFGKNCRYEIRRAPKEGVICEYKAGTDISEQDIEEFVRFFCEFWESKGIKGKKKEQFAKEIREYAEKDAFAITTAKLGEKILVYHTYIVGDNFARLYQSASQFRVDESIPYQVIGMANRYLHKQDMLYFKEKGKDDYDWGGAGKGEDVASITKFKESFGGKPLQVYDFEDVVGLKAKLVKAVIRLLEKF